MTIEIRRDRVSYENAQVRIYPDTKQFYWHGIDMSCRPEIKENKGDVYMIKLKGRMYWSGLGSQSYASPELIIGHVKDGRWVHRIEIEYTKESMREAKNLAYQEFNNLVRERADVGTSSLHE